MRNIRQELQEIEDEYGGYKLKTNDEIIDMISDFGNGMLEFHTVDIERLVVENMELVKELNRIKGE